MLLQNNKKGFFFVVGRNKTVVVFGSFRFFYYVVAWLIILKATARRGNKTKEKKLEGNWKVGKSELEGKRETGEVCFVYIFFCCLEYKQFENMVWVLKVLKNSGELI